VRDILLLSRPDYTVYDEVRNTPDFELYKDLRLT
jgi:ATPase